MCQLVCLLFIKLNTIMAPYEWLCRSLVINLITHRGEPVDHERSLEDLWNVLGDLHPSARP